MGSLPWGSLKSPLTLEGDVSAATIKNAKNFRKSLTSCVEKISAQILDNQLFGVPGWRGWSFIHVIPLFLSAYFFTSFDHNWRIEVPSIIRNYSNLCIPKMFGSVSNFKTCFFKMGGLNKPQRSQQAPTSLTNIFAGLRLITTTYSKILYPQSSHHKARFPCPTHSAPKIPDGFLSPKNPPGIATIAGGASFTRPRGFTEKNHLFETRFAIGSLINGVKPGSLNRWDR